jgi:ribose transport system ATP-binding protein
MDEPTSALSPPEVSRLFELIARARARDRSLVFISHFIEDVLAICDRVTILRDGKCVATERSERLEKSSVIRAMLGQESDVTGAEREPGNRLPPARPGDAGLRCAGLTREGAFRDVTLSVAAGETLGIYGFVGAGHSELAHCLAGSLAADTGRIWVDKHELKPGRASQAIRQGVVFVGADRSQTLVPTSEIYKNVTLAHLRRAAGNWLVERRESQLAQGVLQRVGCRPPNPLLKAGALSGGNQQKVVIAKWLLGPARFWILEEPTRGMDVGAKQEILALIEGLKRDGAGVVLASSEPELILEHADRIVVMSRGRVTHEFADCRVDKSTLIHYA